MGVKTKLLLKHFANSISQIEKGFVHMEVHFHDIITTGYINFS